VAPEHITFGLPTIALQRFEYNSQQPMGYLVYVPPHFTKANGPFVTQLKDNENKPFVSYPVQYVSDGAEGWLR
jgi:hypothetical protein